MNAKKRFLDGLCMRPVDRPAVACVVTAITISMMEKTGIFWPEAHTDTDKLVRLAEAPWVNHQIESIKLPFDMAVKSEALGAQINWGDRENLPTEKGRTFRLPDELFIPEDFLDLGRIPPILRAISRLRQRFDNEVAIISSIVGPFTLAAKLFGFETFFDWLINAPQNVHKIMEKLTDLAIRYSAAQVEAGADTILVGEASCSGSLISPKTYGEFAAPYHGRLCSTIQAPNILHICGKSSNHAPYLKAINTALSFDENSNIETLRLHLKGKVGLVGYIPTIKVFLQGTPEDVRHSALECLDNGVDILAPGCSLPPHTPTQNITAMIKAASEWQTNKTKQLMQ